MNEKSYSAVNTAIVNLTWGLYHAAFHAPDAKIESGFEESIGDFVDEINNSPTLPDTVIDAIVDDIKINVEVIDESREYVEAKLRHLIETVSDTSGPYDNAVRFFTDLLIESGVVNGATAYKPEATDAMLNATYMMLFSAFDNYFEQDTPPVGLDMFLRELDKNTDMPNRIIADIQSTLRHNIIRGTWPLDVTDPNDLKRDIAQHLKTVTMKDLPDVTTFMFGLIQSTGELYN